MRFTLEKLACWFAVGEAGSIARAAGKTRVSQPSIPDAVAAPEGSYRPQPYIRRVAEGTIRL